MPLYRVTVEIEMRVQSPNSDLAKELAETIIERQIVGQNFGSNFNEQGEVTNGEIIGVEFDEANDETEEEN